MLGGADDTHVLSARKPWAKRVKKHDKPRNRQRAKLKPFCIWSYLSPLVHAQKPGTRQRFWTQIHPPFTSTASSSAPPRPPAQLTTSTTTLRLFRGAHLRRCGAGGGRRSGGKGAVWVRG